MRVFHSSMVTSSTSGYAASHARSRASCHAPQADQSRRHITVPISITMLRLRSASGQPPGSMHAWPRRAAQAQEDIRVQRPDHRSPCTLSDQSQSREPTGRLSAGETGTAPHRKTHRARPFSTVASSSGGQLGERARCEHLSPNVQINVAFIGVCAFYSTRWTWR